MAPDNNEETLVPWEEAIREKLKDNPDPIGFQQEILKILLKISGEGTDGMQRAKEKYDGSKPRFFLSKLFGASARVKIIEAFLNYPESWFNLGDLATIAGVGKTSAKRIVDNLLSEKKVIIEESSEESNERLLKLGKNDLTMELQFFYMKLRGLY